MNIVNNSNHDEMIPFEFHLSQNYPNPFKDKTKIKYCIPYKTKVNITVFDPMGNKIETLVDEDKEAGTYEAEFNASELLSGVCFYQMKAEDFIETKKMLLEELKN